MMKRVLLITTIVIVLLCGGCQKTISTDTESWSEIGNNSMGKTDSLFGKHYIKMSYLAHIIH